MKFAVTGGAGFVGNNIVRLLVSKGHSVVVIDNLNTGKKDNLEGVLEKIDFHEIDIRDYNEFYMFFQTPRNLRNDIKKIEFNINYNFDQLTFKLNNIKVNDSINEAINDALSEIILKDSNHQNKIYFKKLVNQAIKLYAG